MTVRKFLFIFSIEFFLIFCFTTSIAFGMSSNNNETIQSGDSLNSEVSNVDFDYYQDFFGLNSYGNTVITRFGKLPLLETREQKENWNSSLKTLSDKIKDNIASKYMYPYGQVVTCGSNSNGYFVILFKYGNVNETLMNEIYSIINDSAKELEIEEIPVEFGYGTYYRQAIPLSPDEARQYEFGESIDNLSESDIDIIEEYMKQKHESLYKGGDIANYGTIPLLKDKKEHNLWIDKLSIIFEEIRKRMGPYMDKGQVRAYGYGSTRLEVGIPENLSSEEKIIISKEVYQIIDEEARKQSITDVPVAFESVGEIIDAIATEEQNIEEPNKSPRDNNSESNNNSNESKSSKNNSTPGFGLLGSLTCLYGAWKLKKK